jgi:hypothetical protein
MSTATARPGYPAPQFEAEAVVDGAPAAGTVCWNGCVGERAFVVIRVRWSECPLFGKHCDARGGISMR